jgi:hypothetical protein
VHPDDGGDTVFRNTGPFKSHTASHPSGRYSSIAKEFLKFLKEKLKLR